MTLPAMPSSDIASRIRATAQQLVAEGTWPTVVNVRERLGTGSNTTINNELRAWRQWFLARVSSSTRRPDWPGVLGDAMDTLWQTACEQAERQLDTLRQEVSAELDALRGEFARQEAALLDADAARQQAQAELARVQDALLAQQQAGERLAQQAAELEAALDRARRDHDTLSGQLQTAAQRHAEALAEQERQAEQRLALAVTDGEKREALAYERLEGLRAMLYEQADRERLEHEQEKKRQDALIADLRQELASAQTHWHERLLGSERERALLEARAEAQLARQAELEARLLDATAREQRQAAREAALEQQLVRLRTEYASDDGTPA